MDKMIIETLLVFAMSFIFILGCMLVRFNTELSRKKTAINKSRIAIFAAQVALCIAIVAFILLFIPGKLGIPRELSYFVTGIVFATCFSKSIETVKKVLR